MKLTKGKKTALISFAAFLAFMAVCTVAAKGIYASGLPRVSTAKPYSGSLTHVITVSGTVMQGQEYGVYVESGLRVDTMAVGIRILDENDTAAAVQSAEITGDSRIVSSADIYL